jgi:hypothetical protein
VFATDVNVGVSLDEDGLQGFYLAIGEHFGAAEKEVIVVREKNIPDDELPVVFFLAQRADVRPAAIIKLRLAGNSWMDISLHFGLHADIYHVSTVGDFGPPYGRALGHYKKQKRHNWHKIRLADADIVTLVNLSFMSKHYGYAPSEVIRHHQKGKKFTAIHKAVRKARIDQEKKAKKVAHNQKSKKAGKGKKNR